VRTQEPSGAQRAAYACTQFPCPPIMPSCLSQALDDGHKPAHLFPQQGQPSSTCMLMRAGRVIAVCLTVGDPTFVFPFTKVCNRPRSFDTHTHTHTLTHMHKCTHAHARTHARTHTHTLLPPCTHKCAHVGMHADACRRTNAYTSTQQDNLHELLAREPSCHVSKPSQPSAFFLGSLGSPPAIPSELAI